MSAKGKIKTRTVTFRISEDKAEKLSELSRRGPYHLTITSIVERGIELAIDELDRMNTASRKDVA